MQTFVLTWSYSCPFMLYKPYPKWIKLTLFFAKLQVLQVFFLYLDVANICNLVHVIRIFVGDPFVSSNHNRLSQTSGALVGITLIGIFRGP